MMHKSFRYLPTATTTQIKPALTGVEIASSNVAQRPGVEPKYHFGTRWVKKLKQ
jgi:hypothetical protein